MFVNKDWNTLVLFLVIFAVEGRGSSYYHIINARQQITSVLAFTKLSLKANNDYLILTY